MKQIPILPALLLALALVPVYSQETADSLSLWMVETRDGNEFTGNILFEDSTGIILHSSIYGELHIPASHIKKRKEIRSDLLVNGEYWFGNPHATRYFFGPTVHGLQQGEGYYQNTWILLNQVHYGISKYLSLGGGIMPLFLFAGAPTPVWLTPKLSVPVSRDKVHLGAGMLFAHILGDGSSFGIAYGASTFGNRENNLTLGAGWGFSGYDGDWVWSDRVTLMLSGMTRGRKKDLPADRELLSEPGRRSILRDHYAWGTQRTETPGRGLRIGAALGYRPGRIYCHSLAKHHPPLWKYQAVKMWKGSLRLALRRDD
jgi:hypothetical protein